MKIKCNVERVWAQNSYGLWVYKYDEHNGDHFVAEPVNLNWKKVCPAELIGEPTLSVSARDFEAQEFFRSLSEALLESQFIPSNKYSSDKEVEALKNHIATLDKISTRLLDKIK